MQQQQQQQPHYQQQQQQQQQQHSSRQTPYVALRSPTAKAVEVLVSLRTELARDGLAPPYYAASPAYLKAIEHAKQDTARISSIYSTGVSRTTSNSNSGSAILGIGERAAFLNGDRFPSCWLCFAPFGIGASGIGKVDPYTQKPLNRYCCCSCGRTICANCCVRNAPHRIYQQSPETPSIPPRGCDTCSICNRLWTVYDHVVFSSKQFEYPIRVLNAVAFATGLDTNQLHAGNPSTLDTRVRRAMRADTASDRLRSLKNALRNIRTVALSQPEEVFAFASIDYDNPFGAADDESRITTVHGKPLPTSLVEMIMLGFLPLMNWVTDLMFLPNEASRGSPGTSSMQPYSDNHGSISRQHEQRRGSASTSLASGYTATLAAAPSVATIQPLLIALASSRNALDEFDHDDLICVYEIVTGTMSPMSSRSTRSVRSQATASSGTSPTERPTSAIDVESLRRDLQRRIDAVPETLVDILATSQKTQTVASLLFEAVRAHHGQCHLCKLKSANTLVLCCGTMTMCEECTEREMRQPAGLCDECEQPIPKAWRLSALLTPFIL
ncbi:hypothetical protein GQ42DRAFT_161553 [Ramicandelaber brevisporus]|nr:hypothetical protein GQ42DRAFT_161553 [Ramicandelaber brevisporus]